MAFVLSDSKTGDGRAFALGPARMQVCTYTCLAGDTSATLTFDRLTRCSHLLLDGGLVYTAAPTVSGNTATLAFTAPAGGGFGTVYAIGK